MQPWKAIMVPGFFYLAVLLKAGFIFIGIFTNKNEIVRKNSA